MASNWSENWASNWADNWGAVSGTVPIVQPVLKVTAPRTRSIDAKSIADRFNQGEPIQADYEWPGGRKFYQ